LKKIQINITNANKHVKVLQKIIKGGGGVAGEPKVPCFFVLKKIHKQFLTNNIS
jgi:hypothetical protein